VESKGIWKVPWVDGLRGLFQGSSVSFAKCLENVFLSCRRQVVRWPLRDMVRDKYVLPLLVIKGILSLSFPLFLHMYFHLLKNE